MPVGADDPSTTNWLETSGRPETILLARYLLPTADRQPNRADLTSLSHRRPPETPSAPRLAGPDREGTSTRPGLLIVTGWFC